MQDSGHQPDDIPSDIQEAIRAFVSAVNAVKLYPANNPIYASAVAKSFHALNACLVSHPELRLGVQKTNFLYMRNVVGKDTQVHKGLAGDLFAKGIREIAFLRGITAKELRDLFGVLAMPAEEIKLKSGVASLIWETGLPHVSIQEAMLGEVMLAESGTGAIDEAPPADQLYATDEIRKELEGKSITIFQQTVMLADLAADPALFGAQMVERARQAGGSQEEQEQRLYESYREMGRQVLSSVPQNRDPLFQAMAASVLSLEPIYREGIVARKLYAQSDQRAVMQQQPMKSEHLPDHLHEVVTGRFARAWSVPQVSSLLRQSAEQIPPPIIPQEEKALPAELFSLSREMADYTPEEMESLRMISEYGIDDDIIEAAVRTLIYLLPNVHSPFQQMPPERELQLFSGIVIHLEDLLVMLLERKDYVLAGLVVRAFRVPVEPPFQQRLAEALRKAGDRKTISRVISVTRNLPPDSENYRAAYAYLTLLDREATPLLLEMLAEEEDRHQRKQLMDLLKGLGKTQLALLGEKLSDERWYYVRNIVSILGESKKDEVIRYLEKVTDHKNFQIRQEVVRALIAIQGKKAAQLLTRFLRDKDIDIQFMAIRGLGTLSGADDAEAQELLLFAGGGGFKGVNPELKKEAIDSIGKIGSQNLIPRLIPFTKIKWWRARKPQEEIREVADRAIAAIEGRYEHAAAGQRAEE